MNRTIIYKALRTQWIILEFNKCVTSKYGCSLLLHKHKKLLRLAQKCVPVYIRYFVFNKITTPAFLNDSDRVHINTLASNLLPCQNITNVCYKFTVLLFTHIFHYFVYIFDFKYCFMYVYQVM